MSSTCRLCGAATTNRFKKTILGKHLVEFQECTECDSMQTEEPFWLDESYADGRRYLDINAASRALIWQRLIYGLHRAFEMKSDARLLDWGAGDGLLVRLLRDIGIDARYNDPLAVNQYANGFEADFDDKPFEIVSAFEVWEHLSNPSEELQIALSQQPQIYIASTEIYRQQDESWTYLNLMTGRHVFFYSEKAVRYIANKYGYDYYIAKGKRVMLYKPIFSKKQVVSAKRVLDDRRARLNAVWFAMARKGSLAAKDRQEINKRVKKTIELDGN